MSVLSAHHGDFGGREGIDMGVPGLWVMSCP
jgi:hypothetical protein